MRDPFTVSPTGYSRWHRLLATLAIKGWNPFPLTLRHSLGWPCDSSQQYTNCGPGTSRLSVTQDLLKMPISESVLDLLNEKLEVGHSKCF